MAPVELGRDHIECGQPRLVEKHAAWVLEPMVDLLEDERLALEPR